MACEVGGTASFADSPFDDNWAKSENITTNLDAIRDFNTELDQQSNGTIDPSMTYSNPSTPHANNQNAFNFNATVNANLQQSLSPAPTYEAYPTFFHNTQSSPYFQCLEPNNGPMYQPSPLRREQYGHRRSVSEPPGMPEQPSMVFHRDEHWIGRPKVAALKSLPRHKSSRGHPYPASARKSARHQPQPIPHQQAMDQHSFRPSMQRAHTQPARQYAPTSAPIMSPQQYMNMAPPHLQQASNQHFHTPLVAQMTPENIFIQSTSRVCTPARIDPMLSEPATPPSGRSRKRETIVNIPITIDELREMIFDAVQKAVHGTSSGKADPGELGDKKTQNRSPSVDEEVGGVRTIKAAPPQVDEKEAQQDTGLDADLDVTTKLGDDDDDDDGEEAIRAFLLQQA